MANTTCSYSRPRSAMKSTAAEQETHYVIREPTDEGPSAMGDRHRSAQENGDTALNIEEPGQPPAPANGTAIETAETAKDYGLFTVKGASEYVKPYMVSTVL